MVKVHRVFFILLGVGLLGLSSAAAIVVLAFARVPAFDEMKSSVTVNIQLANGTKATRKVGPKARDWVPMSQVSNHLLTAVISSEDSSFWSHEGIDYFELKESIKKDLQEKRWARGASTITQQVVKNVYLSREKTISRKIKEMIWARELDKKLSKHEILCFYVNLVEFGPGIYGIGQASRHYFQKSPGELSARESAFLAMMLPAPTKYYTYFRQKKMTVWATKRVNQILRVMHRMGALDDATYESALHEPLWGEKALDVNPEEAPGNDDSELTGFNNLRPEPPPVLAEPENTPEPEAESVEPPLESDPPPGSENI